jgi:hypothetical protein
MVGERHCVERQAEGEHVAEHLIVRFEVEKVGVGARGVRAAIAAAREHVCELLRMNDRQRTEERAVDEAEHRGVEADADRQRRDGDQREAGIAAKPARRVADIGHSLFEHGSPRVCDERKPQ